MAWRGRLGEAGDSGLELSLGLPAYFAKPSSGLDAGEEPGDAAAFALRAGKGNDGSKARARPAGAAPVVGWPPVRSFRRNLASSRQSPQSSSAHHHQDGGAKGGKGGAGAGEGGGLFVKINMDGVPIGRKVDLTAYGGYGELSAAVGKLFRGLLAEGPGGGTALRRGCGGGRRRARDRRRVHAGVRGRGGRPGAGRRRALGDVRGHREEAARAQELRPASVIAENRRVQEEGCSRLLNDALCFITYLITSL
ncbi:unnamed protein product [Urochloa decumbens]|uniref:Auxin-responsive protein n=1 Tax=Urochloa decumbens TaxID=240449 RepID=A0ABC9AIC8_9POAL